MNELVVLLDSGRRDHFEKPVEAARLEPVQQIEERRAAELFRQLGAATATHVEEAAGRQLGDGSLGNRIACTRRCYAGVPARDSLLAP